MSIRQWAKPRRAGNKPGHLDLPLVIQAEPGGPVLHCHSIEEIASVPLTKALQEFRKRGTMNRRDRIHDEIRRAEARIDARCRHFKEAHLERVLAAG